MRASHVGICVCVLALLAPVQVRIDAARATCDSLASLRLPNAAVTSATEVAAGAFAPPTAPGRGVAPALAKTMASLQPFCRVQITSRPTTDSDIQIEVWLPATSWNGKFQAVGNGGWAGTISYPAMTAAMARGYATASTDSGHTTPGASFAVGHPEKLVDYAHRSLHELAVSAKAIVEAHYGTPATAAVWNGCSTGGNQGLTLASMYPNDFDAIVAGAKDGVKDGVLENPASCRFDPKVLTCKGADEPSCLTPEQVETARALVSHVKHPRTGRILNPPLLQPGSELLWGTLAGPKPFGNAAEAYKYLVSKDPAWEPSQFDADTGVELTDASAAVPEYGQSESDAIFRTQR